MPSSSKSQPKRRNNLSIEQLAQQQQQQQAQPAPNPAYVNLMNRIQAQGGILGDFAHMSLGEIMANDRVKSVSAFQDINLDENGIGDHGIFTIDLNDGRSTETTDLVGGRITLFSESDAWVQTLPNGSSLTRYADGSWRFVDKSDKDHITEYTWDANQQVTEASQYSGSTSNLGDKHTGYWSGEIARPDARIQEEHGVNQNPIIRTNWQQLASAIDPNDPPEFYDIVRTGRGTNREVPVRLVHGSGESLDVTLGIRNNPESYIQELGLV